MWYVPSVQDMRCILVFVVLTATSFLFSYFYIMDRPADAKTERVQASILIYGSAQSFIGFMGGFYISKLIYAREPYDFVRSDEDIMEI
jgi:hypothetical protein